MKDTAIDVVGAADVEAAFEELAQATTARTAKGALRRGFIDAAQPMADHASQLAAKDTGEMARGFTVGTSLANTEGSRAFAAAKAAGASTADAVSAMRDAQRAVKAQAPDVVVYVGVRGPAAWRAHFPEFGTVKMAARPALRPAFEAQAETVAARFQPSVTKALGKAAQRAARRAAKRRP